MAGRGPAPKAPDERRNTTAPQRGEWVDLAPLAEPVLPELPDGEWSVATRMLWAAWRVDPVTSQYSPADIAYAIETICLREAMTPSTANEIRLRSDALGLTPKGKRDLRWRIVEEKPVERRVATAGRKRAHLTAVQ
jgi:hypothetical protein